MATQKVVEAVTKRKPTPEEWETLLENRIPELVRQCKAGALDPAGMNASLQYVIEGSVITASKEVVVASPKPKPSKFAFFVDLGIITVPDDFVHATHFGTFWPKHQSGKKKSFYDYNKNITDANFSNPSRILKPGDKLWVWAVRQIVGGTTTSVERMDFCRKQDGNQFVGAQGLSHVFEQKRDQLPKGKWYASFDETDRLWEYSAGNHAVPLLDANDGGVFDFRLGLFEDDWNDDFCLLCFCDLRSATPSGEALPSVT